MFETSVLAANFLSPWATTMSMTKEQMQNQVLFFGGFVSIERPFFPTVQRLVDPQQMFPFLGRSVGGSLYFLSRKTI